MDSGQLRHRVTIMSPPDPAGPKNSYNKPTGAWTATGTYWAFVKPLAGRELEVAQQIRGDVSHLVTMRRVGPIAPPQYLLYKGKRLNIDAVIDVDERGKELHIYCTQPGATDIRP